MSSGTRYRWPVTVPSSASARSLRVGACLSLSGSYSRFGRQAAAALEIWRNFDGSAELIVADDESDPRILRSALPRIMDTCDVILGPYSTQLTRIAGKIASGAGRILWNHGGSGDDIEAAFPKVMLSVLTPTSRYAEPFIRRLAAAWPRAPLRILQGKGSFGRQVCDGAEAAARRAGIDVTRFACELPSPGSSEPWDLFSAGIFEDDVEAVLSSRRASPPPRVICSVAAGVRDFCGQVGEPEGIYGVGQWFPSGPSAPHHAHLGPAEGDFLNRYVKRFGDAPDYPAVQAAATAVIASHCFRRAVGPEPEAVWQAAAHLDVHTLFGRFRVDPVTGTQLGHEATLVRWTASDLVRA